jgi:hypothetical protein
MPQIAKPKRLSPTRPRQHTAPFDRWSLVHLGTGGLMGWVMQPFVALSIMVLWEPLELLILSPLLGRAGIVFGDESVQNSLSDIFFDVVGVALGVWLLANLVSPPFRLF